MTAPPSDRESGAVLSFAYHKSIAPTLGVLLGLAIVETLVLHVVAMALWGWRIALALGLLDVGAVVALVGLMRAIRRYPVTLSPDLLTMRLGRLRTIAVPVAQIAGLRETWDAASLKQGGMVNLALATWPNVVVDLRAPVHARRRDVHAIAHKLDDPEAFAAAIRRLSP